MVSRYVWKRQFPTTRTPKHTEKNVVCELVSVAFRCHKCQDACASVAGICGGWVGMGVGVSTRFLMRSDGVTDRYISTYINFDQD